MTRRTADELCAEARKHKPRSDRRAELLNRAVWVRKQEIDRAVRQARKQKREK